MKQCKRVVASFHVALLGRFPATHKIDVVLDNDNASNAAFGAAECSLYRTILLLRRYLGILTPIDRFTPSGT